MLRFFWDTLYYHTIILTYSRDDNVTSVLSAILIPNGLFVLSVVVLVYW